MRILVCGGRDFTDYDKVFETLHNYDLYVANVKTIISGGARGADALGEQVAETLGANVLKFPADWVKHGKKAGPIRNTQMLKEGKPDLVIAFPGGRGTSNMIEQAKKAGVEVIVVE